MNVQMCLEDSIYKLAEGCKEPSVILMDRGLMDGAAFMGPEQWERLLKETGFTAHELRDNRYDAIVHMVTAAEGCPECYDYDNVARYHTPE